MMPLADRQKSVTTGPFVQTQYGHWTERERQTDRQTELVEQYRAVHCMLTSDENRLVKVGVTKQASLMSKTLCRQQ